MTGHEARAQVWIEEHPDVFRLFERFALQAADRRRRFGIKALAERVRWEVALSWEKDAAGYRLNNNLTAYLARELIRRHPDLEQFIETRKLRAKGPAA